MNDYMYIIEPTLMWYCMSLKYKIIINFNKHFFLFISGAFLIPFVIFLFLGGFPLYFLELSMGQFSGKSYIHFYDVCPMFKGK